MTALRDRLIHVKWLRTTVQLLVVAASVRPTLRFLGDAARGRGRGRYVARRTGQAVHLRPRLDLQVAREHVSKASYAPPAPVRAALAAREAELTIADLGANIGLFSLSALAHYGDRTRVIAVEPDAENLELLRRNIADNAYEDAVTVVPAAAGTRAGSLRFVTGRRELSRAARPSEHGADTVTVEMVDALELVRACDLLKIDIEGGEWPLLRDPRFAELGARAVALEWHARGEDLGDDPGGEAARLLRAAGFETAAEPSGVPHIGFVWAWR